jgi:carboxymethylenebutenolidase
MGLITQMLEFPANGSAAPGYLARPEGAGAYPGVVVIQEWWGLNDHIKDVANRIAEQGFVALAPDLYRGVVVSEPGEANKLMMKLSADQALKDMQGAVNYLIAQPFVAPKKAGVIGFCMGGGMALMLAHEGQHLGAAISFYGLWQELSDAEVDRVSAPVLGIFGERDASVPLSGVRATEAKLKARGKTAEFHIYPNADHAFFNDTRPVYNAAAASDAWQKSLAWFRQHLA